MKFERTVHLKSVTLATMVEQEQIDLAQYDGLIMDTQGSELLVLRGAESLLHHFRYIKTEVADFESYSGCCQVADIADFLLSRDYREFYRRAFASRRKVAPTMTSSIAAAGGRSADEGAS